MAVALPFILQLFSMAPQLAGAAQTLHSIFSTPGVSVVDSRPRLRTSRRRRPR